jgi:hypothetical protein
MQISKSVRKIIIPLITVFIGAILFTIGTHYIKPRRIGSSVTCGSHLSGISKTIILYASEHYNYIPDANKWCDLMILEADAPPKIFLCTHSDKVLGESSYALNKYIAGKKINEVSPDTVLVFDTYSGKSKAGRTGTISSRYCYQQIKAKGGNMSMFGKNPEKTKVYKDRWNQAGGPELLTADNHSGEGANIALAGGYVVFFKKAEFGELNWGNKTADPNSGMADRK